MFFVEAYVSTDDEFSEIQRRSLERFVTNLDGNVFALKNLPEVVKGALFSKYSRSILGLRSLLLKEFIESEESNFIDQIDHLHQVDTGIKQASSFYQRVLDGYGDDSVGELGGAHLALESISMLAAKIVEDARIGGSPLEKSTRYVYFDQKVNGDYLFYKDPILMTSAYKELYLSTCRRLFETYSSLIVKVSSYFEKLYPKDPDTPISAYKVSLRAKVLDTLRGLLPTSTLTNVGLFGNGRYWQNLMYRLQSHNLSEIKDLGSQSLVELKKVIPAFVSRAEAHHKHCEATLRYHQIIKEQLSNFAEKVVPHEDHEVRRSYSGVKLVYGDPDGIFKVCAGLLFPYTQASLDVLVERCKQLSHDDIMTIFEAISSERENRRHKTPRGLECVQFGFDIVGDFGAYRDLQRHRILTQERQLLTTHLGYSFPEELLDTPMEQEFRSAMEMAADAYESISVEFPEEAQYVVPMGYNIRWFFHINGRSLQWLCELRSQKQGHTNYRRIAVAMAQEVVRFNPAYEVFFKFVDSSEVGLGRLGQEIYKETKTSS